MGAHSLNRLVLVFTIGVLIILRANNSCKQIASETPDMEFTLSSKLPTHSIDYTKSQNNVQTQFDTEMWKTFIALCSPSDGLKPTAKGKITDQNDARSVFQNYSFNYDLFLLNPTFLRDTTKNTNFKPVGWGHPDSLNRQRRERWNYKYYCPDLVAQAEAKGITNMASLLPLDEFIQASNSERPHVPLIDQNQNYVRTGVVYNKITFDWVIANKLQIYEGVKNAESKLTRQKVTQVNNQGQKTTFYQMVNELKTPIGAIQLKTSWKILGDEDDPSKFHTAWAVALFENFNFIKIKMDTIMPMEPKCSIVQVGLVGMHIAKKTETQPDYNWATFEHIDNCPEVKNIQNKHYSFYSYADKDSKKPNRPPKPNENVNEKIPPKAFPYKYGKWFNPKYTPRRPSQILREIPIPAGTQAVNRFYQQALVNTVWANYQLVGTQWTDPNGKIIPALLSNSTLETFEQKKASCIGCHHQLKPNTFKGTINDNQFNLGNVRNLKLNLRNTRWDQAVYSDYMWSLLKWSPKGQLTGDQIRENDD